MANMSKSFLCLVCRKRQNLYFKYRGFYYFKCPNCGLVSTFPFPSESTTQKHYKSRFKKGNYELLTKYSSEYGKIYKQYADCLSHALHKSSDSFINKKVLDIGCFTGDFLSILKKMGADVYGIELQDDAVLVAKSKLGENRVLQNNVLKHHFRNKKFNIVTMFGLLEHVTNPSSLIKKSHQILDSGGLLIIQTPNSGSILAKILNKYWPPYSPIEHIHLFTRKSLRILLEASGFQVLEIKSHIKFLPISYIYEMLDSFGPELKILFKPIWFLMPIFKKLSIPSYIGEMIVTASKK